MKPNSCSRPALAASAWAALLPLIVLTFCQPPKPLGSSGGAAARLWPVTVKRRTKARRSMLPLLDNRLAGEDSLAGSAGGGQFDAAKTTDIFADTTVEGLCDLLAIFGSLQFALIFGIADEGDLRQHRGHVGADEHDEGGLLHAAVAHAVAEAGEAAVQGALHVGGEFARFLNFFL